MGTGGVQGSFVNVGGVKLTRDQIHMIERPSQDSNRYLVMFKNGTVATYPEQPAENGAIIDSGDYSDSNGSAKINKVNVIGLQEGYILGAENKKDEIFLFDCAKCDVDVSNDKGIFKSKKVVSDSVTTYATPGKRPAHNNIFLDSFDTFNFANTSGQEPSQDYGNTTYGTSYYVPLE